MPELLTADDVVYAIDKDVPPRLRVMPPAEVTIATLDARAGRLTRPEEVESTAPDYRDRFPKANPATGPIFIEGAEPGDVLSAEILRIELGQRGYTLVKPDFGVIRGVVERPVARFAEVRDGAIDFAGVRLPLRPMVGVIATAATVRSDAYRQALAELRPDLEVLSLACPLFVPLVEEGWHEDPIAEEVARRYLEPLLVAGVDTLVLGCTHYPLLAPVIARVAGPGVTLVDSAESVADEVAAGLAERGLAIAEGASEAGETAAAPDLHVCVTDAGAGFGEFAARILGEETKPLEWVDVG